MMRRREALNLAARTQKKVQSKINSGVQSRKSLLNVIPVQMKPTSTSCCTWASCWWRWVWSSPRWGWGTGASGPWSWGWWVMIVIIIIIIMIIIIKVGPCLLGLGVMMVTLRLLFCRGLPCTRGLASDDDDIIMVRPRHEAEEVVIRSEEEEEATAATRQMVEGKSYKARIIVNHHSYNKQAPL